MFKQKKLASASNVTKKHTSYPDAFRKRAQTTKRRDGDGDD